MSTITGAFPVVSLALWLSNCWLHVTTLASPLRVVQHAVALIQEVGYTRRRGQLDA